jgi:hypothetical protein
MIAGCKKLVVRILTVILVIVLLVISVFTFPISIPPWVAFAFWKVFRWSKLGFAPSWLRVILFLISSGGFVPVWANVVNTTGIGNPLSTQMRERQLEAVSSVADSLGWIVVTNASSASAQSAIQTTQATSVPNACQGDLVVQVGLVALVTYPGGVNVRTGPGENYPIIETWHVDTEHEFYANTAEKVNGAYWIVLDPECTRWVYYHDGGKNISITMKSPS